MTGLAGSKPASSSRWPMMRRPSHHPSDFARRSTWSSDSPSALPTSRSSALGTVCVQRRRQRRAVPAVLGVDVLHHFLAPLVLEVDVDVGRLVALLADEALEQHAHA
jgi:hypothetical protein